MTVKKKPTGLVNRFAHTYNDDGEIVYQVEIIAELPEGYYLVQYFDFMMGNESSQGIYHVSEMKGWKIYGEHQDWLDAYERYSENRRIRERNKKEAV